MRMKWNSLPKHAAGKFHNSGYREKILRIWDLQAVGRANKKNRITPNNQELEYHGHFKNLPLI